MTAVVWRGLLHSNILEKLSEASQPLLHLAVGHTTLCETCLTGVSAKMNAR